MQLLKTALSLAFCQTSSHKKFSLCILLLVLGGVALFSVFSDRVSDVISAILAVRILVQFVGRHRPYIAELQKRSGFYKMENAFVSTTRYCGWRNMACNILFNGFANDVVGSHRNSA